MTLPCPTPAPRRRRPSAAAVALFALLAACSSGGKSSTEPDPDPIPPTELPSGVHALAGIGESLPYTDLEPFRAIIGSTPFVALGESTHTSAGFYQAKARLIRFMVEQMGFRVIAWETPWLEALPAARYVATCEGSTETALAGLNGVWRDTHVRDLLQWLCEYNRAHPGDPVTFFGFDIQEPGQSYLAARRFIESAAPGETARTEPMRACYGATYPILRDFYLSQAYQDYRAGRRDADAHGRCIGGITAMEAWIAANAPALRSATSAAAVEEARLALVALRAWEDQLWIPDPGGYQARDFGMAELLRRVHALHTPGRKTVVWAWNWHIARRYEEVRGWDDDPQANVPRQGGRSMGSFLREALGADYLPIGLIGYRVEGTGGTNPPLQTNPLSVEKRLHDLGRPHLLVDLRQPLPGSLLPAGQTVRVSQEWGDPYRQFGALLFIEHSPPITYASSTPGAPHE